MTSSLLSFDVLISKMDTMIPTLQTGSKVLKECIYFVLPQSTIGRVSSQVPLASCFPAALGLHVLTEFTLHRDLYVLSNCKKLSTPLCLNRAVGGGAAGYALHTGA